MGSPQNYISVTRRPPDVEDYIDMLRRYKSWIIGPMFAGLVISVVVAFLWPDTYVSQAVMRITPQQVSERLLPAVINTQLGERINQMQQEILSRSSLQELILKPSLNLYKKERERLPMEDIIQRMRNKDIKIQMIQTPGGGDSDGRRYASAFSIQFAYRDRYLAQAVVNEMVAKFMEQNVTVQRNRAQTTDQFLGDELKKARDDMVAAENSVTKFRMENQGRLPEQLGANMQAQAQLQMQISALDEALGRDQQDKLILETSLKNLKSREAFTRSTLEETVSGPASVKNQRLVDLNNRIVEGKSQLAALRQTFKDNYPDIQQYKARIAALEKERDALEKEEERRQANPRSEPAKVVNPQAAKALEDIKNEENTVITQIAAKQADIEAKIRRQGELNKMLGSYQTRIETGSANQQQYESLIRDYNLAKSQYEEMSKRKDISDTAKDLEDRKAGENLEVLDPASLPEQPAEPNRWAIAGIGTAVGLMCGIVLAGAKEVKNTSLKNLKDVRAYTNLPVLSSIPLLENALLVRRKRRLFWLAWSSSVVFGIMAMSISMYYYFFGRTS